MATLEEEQGLEKIKQAFIKQLEFKILNEEAKVTKAKLKLEELGTQLLKLKCEGVSK